MYASVREPGPGGLWLTPRHRELHGAGVTDALAVPASNRAGSRMEPAGGSECSSSCVPGAASVDAGKLCGTAWMLEEGTIRSQLAGV